MVSESAKNAAFLILIVVVFILIFIIVIDIFYRKLIAQNSCVYIAQQIWPEILKALGIRPFEWLCKALIKF